ncbi:MAG: glycosyltransferase family 2 protein [Acidimicrobiales bacterium]
MSGPYRAGDICVVIPTRDRWPVLARALDHLRAQSVRGFSIVVVVDGTDQLVPDLGDDVTTVCKEHAGPGAARNEGVRVGDREIVLLLGDDMMADVHLVEAHLALHNAHPEAEVAVLGHVDWHSESSRGRYQRWLDWSGTQFAFPTTRHEDAGAGRFYSSNVSVKRALYEAVGGFDEDFPFVYEDIDLGMRLADKDMRLLYEPAAHTFHLHRYSWASLEGRFRVVGTGEQIICAKRPDFAPFFLDKMRTRPRVAPVSLWPRVVDVIPRSSPRLRHYAQQHADAWYLKHLTAQFLVGWTAGAELTELRDYLGARFDFPRLVGRGSPRPDSAVDDELYRQSAAVMEGRWRAAEEEILRLVPKGARLRLMGTAAGSIGLHLLGSGHDVCFVAPPGPASDFLTWRLERRNAGGTVVTSDPQPTTLSVALSPTADDRAEVERDASLVTLVVDRAEERTALGWAFGHDLIRMRRCGPVSVVAYRPSSRGGLRSAWERHVGRRRRVTTPWPPTART